MRVQLLQIFLALAGRSVLSGLDLSTNRNEYVVILGPSGCGKTTTLRIIAGLQQPDRGELLLDGTPFTAVSPRRRGVSMVFQQDGLYPHLTVERSIRLGVSQKISDDELRSRLAQAVELTRIDGLLDRFPDQLSGGELRRAAVAKAIVRQSPVRLLDEPLSALDASARHSLQEDLLRWHQTVPGTTIHVTHDGYEAMRMADRIAILDGGRIQQFDTPERIYHQPHDVTVARAIGSPSINLVPAKIERGRLVTSDPRVHVALDHQEDGPDREILIGVRPEALQVVDGVADQMPERSGLSIDAQLIEIRRGIHNHSVRGELNAEPLQGVMPDGLSDFTIQPGATVRLHAIESQLHLFEKSSGKRIG